MGWRDRILNDFISEVNRLTLVADPDGLLTEEVLVTRLREKGFEIIEYEDSISFRYAYETKYRSLWDKGIYTDLIVILRTEEEYLDNLPYDLYERGRKLAYNIKTLFPDLSYPVIEELDKKYFDTLYESQSRSLSQTKGNNATKDFILEYVYAIKPESVTTITQLLRLLLKIHYSKEKIPDSFITRVIQVIKKNREFNQWPLEQLFLERDAFFHFLQERWPIFLDLFKNNVESDTWIISSKKSAYNLHYPGPEFLPFDDEEIKIYIDNLFVEGILQPIICQNCDLLKNTWVKYGIRDTTEEELLDRLNERMNRLTSLIPGDNSGHSDWLNFSLDYAELKNQIYSKDISGFEPSSSIFDVFLNVSIEINRKFSEWLYSGYSGLINLPPIPPVIVHQIPRFLHRQIEKDPSVKIALIVVDGLSLSQWHTVRDELKNQNPTIRFDQKSIFSWIPTLTSVSRQTIFSGKIPFYFGDNINKTSGEPKSWQNYWEDAGIHPHQISYRKNLLDEDISAYLKSEFTPQNSRIFGCVINKIDNIMHGMQLGEEGMHSQIEQWTKKGYLNELISHLLENGFSIWITSDHGNIESTGIGSPYEGSLSDTKGERVRIFTDKIIRHQIAEKINSVIEWDPNGLPKKYFPLFALDNFSFEKSGKKSVSHGGTSIDEVIVPFISITRGENN